MQTYPVPFFKRSLPLRTINMRALGFRPLALDWLTEEQATHDPSPLHSLGVCNVVGSCLFEFCRCLQLVSYIQWYSDTSFPFVADRRATARTTETLSHAASRQKKTCPLNMSSGFFYWNEIKKTGKVGPERGRSYCWWFRNPGRSPPGIALKPCTSWHKLPTATGTFKKDVRSPSPSPQKIRCENMPPLSWTRILNPKRKHSKRCSTFCFCLHESPPKHYASGARQIWELGVARIFCHNRERFGALEASIQHILLGGSGPRIRKWWSDHPPLKDAIQFGHLGPGSHNPDP